MFVYMLNSSLSFCFSGKKRSRRGKLVQMMTLKPRGVEGGAKAHTSKSGDDWQNKIAYEVEEVNLYVQYV